MSSSEFSSPSGSYSHTFSALVAGEAPSAEKLKYFYLNNSVVDSIKRTTPGGTPGEPAILNVQPLGLGDASSPGCSIELISSVNTDTSVYTMTWHNVSNSALWN